jgi:hypothetical protein
LRRHQRANQKHTDAKANSFHFVLRTTARKFCGNSS